MNYQIWLWIVFATLIVILNTSCGFTAPRSIDGPKGLPGSNCSVTQTPAGAEISCTDGTRATIANGLNGNNGSNGSNGSNGQDGSNGHDGSNGINGNNGANGHDGQAGSSCHVEQLANGAIVRCDDGSSAVVLNGLSGADGQDGHDAMSGVIGISEIINPCGAQFAFEEVFLRLTDGHILALYDGGANLDRLSLLVPGSYMTTDTAGNNRCYFTVDANMHLINQHN